MAPPYSNEFKQEFWNLKTLDEAYTEGFSTGQNWDHPWIPGGPHAHTIDPRDATRDPEFYEQCVHTNNYRREWLRGWHDGFQNK